jgi:hypothetical protein
VIPRVPLNALMTAIDARLQADVTAARFYAFAPANQSRPYGELVTIVVDPDAYKDVFSARVVASFAVYGIHPTALDADSIAESAIKSLCKSPFDLSASQWQDKDGGRFDGTLRAGKVQDDVGEIYWQVQFDISWALRSTAG